MVGCSLLLPFLLFWFLSFVQNRFFFFFWVNIYVIMIFHYMTSEFFKWIFWDKYLFIILFDCLFVLVALEALLPERGSPSCRWALICTLTSKLWPVVATTGTAASLTPTWPQPGIRMPRASQTHTQIHTQTHALNHTQKRQLPQRSSVTNGTFLF